MTQVRNVSLLYTMKNLKHIDSVVPTYFIELGQLHGINRQFTAHDTPQQNGMDE